MSKHATFFSWLLALTASGCGAGVSSGPSDAATTDTPAADTPALDAPTADTPALDAPTSCRLSSTGAQCPVGTTCPAGDGCNTCACGSNGSAVCTTLPCVRDASTADACEVHCPPLLPGCHYEGSATCNPPTCPRLVCVDAGTDATIVDATRTDVTSVDAGPDVTCVIDCAPPPFGCHYEGSPTCSPPMCPRLVCADAGTAIMCGLASSTFPTFDRSCSAHTDCFVAIHQIDCCGSMRAIGINNSQRAAFNVAEGVCRPMYPECDCAARPTVTDDGASATSASAIVVVCQAGTCNTAVRM